MGLTFLFYKGPFENYISCKPLTVIYDLGHTYTQTFNLSHLC